MISSLNSKKVLLPSLLLELYYNGMTGEVTVKDDRRVIRIYVKTGNVVYIDGLNKESQLLKEIASRKGLDQNQLEELKNIGQKDPQSLGKILIERKFISLPGWKRFLEIKVKHILAVASKMETAALGFSETELNILPINLIDYDMIPLLLDTIRLIKDLKHFEKHIPGDDAVFTLSEGAKEFQAIAPFNHSELAIFSMLDGEKTAGEIIADTGLAREVVYKILYLLLRIDVITLVPKEGKEKPGEVDYAEIINIYLDLLRILETTFRKEVGKRFEIIFRRCLGEMTGQSKELLHKLDLSKDFQEGMVMEISGRFAEQGKTTEGRLFISASFNKLIFLLIVRMRKLLGLGPAEKALREMMNILEYVEKHRRDAEIMNYVRGNLRDYLQQIL